MFARLSYSRNLLIQNKLGPLIREPNFHDSFRKTIRYYIFSADFFIVFSGDSPSFCLTG